MDLLVGELNLARELLALSHGSSQVELEESELGLVGSGRRKVMERVAFSHVVLNLSDEQRLLGEDRAIAVAAHLLEVNKSVRGALMPERKL